MLPQQGDPLTQAPDEPESAGIVLARLLLVVLGLAMMLAAAWGLAMACLWALFSAASVGAFLGPETETEQTTGVFLALGGAALAGTAFAAGLALIVQGSLRRWPKNRTLLAPPAVAIAIAVAVAMFSSAVN